MPRDYPDLDVSKMHIYLINADDRLLKSMDPASSARAEKDLAKLGVKIMLKSMTPDYVDKQVVLKDGTTIPPRRSLVSGIRANTIEGIPAESIGRGRPHPHRPLQ